MLRSPVYYSLSSSYQVHLVLGRPFLVSNGIKPYTTLTRCAPPSVVKASVDAPMDHPLSAKAVVTVHRPLRGLSLNFGIKQRLHDITDLWGAKTLVLELLSAEIDSSELTNSRTLYGPFIMCMHMQLFGLFPMIHYCF